MNDGNTDQPPYVAGMSSGFDTARLQVRNWRGSLDDGLRQQQLCEEFLPVLTADVLQHLPPPLQLSGQPDEIAKWVQDRAAESNVFTIRTNDRNALVGLLILAEFPADDHGPSSLHLGFLFAQNAWGQGYASELVEGLVQWADNRGTPTQLLGGVEKSNPASARVLQKCGFEKVADMSGEETDMFGRLIKAEK